MTLKISQVSQMITYFNYVTTLELRPRAQCLDNLRVTVLILKI